MSHVAYTLQLQDALNDLQEQLKVEQEPFQLNEQGKINMETWAPDGSEIFMHLCVLYIKYIDIYRKLEECYDQIVHPQKRYFIKKTLECTIARICEMKKDLVDLNPRPYSIYVHMDQLLFDLKYDPSIIEIPVPRYFKEDDRIPVEVTLAKVEKEGGGKKKKKPKKKKKKKKDDDEGEKKPPPMPLDEKSHLMNHLLKKYKGYDEPEVEVVQDPFTLDIDIVQAIRIIQKNDRGRQGRQRISIILKNYQNTIMQAEMVRKLREGKLQEQSKDQKEIESCVLLQKRMRGILARKSVELLRNEEMEFLGMSRKKKTPEEMLNDPIKKMEQTLLERKKDQDGHMKAYDRDKEMIKGEIDDNQGTDIMEKMLNERREWVNEQRGVNLGKPPEDVKGFYERMKTETPMSPEDEAAAKAEEDGAAGGKKKAEKKKEGGKKKGKGKKGKDDGGDGPEALNIGPSEIVQRFDEQYEDFNENWNTRDESENYKQEYDVDLTKQEVLPLLEEEYKLQVDEMIKTELDNMRLLAGGKGKKKKGKKKKKKGKKKKKKGLKLPGFKMIKDMQKEEILMMLIQNNIVKKIPAARLTDFIGEFNYIAQMQDIPTQSPIDPSMALIRQLVTEYIIFPLGSELCRTRHRTNISSFLFYGPQGTGKTLVVRAIVHETNSILFDLSPINIDGKFTEKKGEEKMVAAVMVTAKEYQPSVIYIDECEKVWPAKKKGGKKKGAKKKKADPSNPSRIKKVLTKWKAKFVDSDNTMRITIIGCTNLPQEGTMKDFKKFFTAGKNKMNAIWFSVPDYSTLRMMWRRFIEKHGGRLKSDFPLSTLAQISLGYSAGSIKKTCEKVLTDYRISHQDQRPLSIQEFIGPLSLCSNLMEDEHEELEQFGNKLTGQDKRIAEAQAILAGEAPGETTKKKKKKKK